MYGSVYIFGAVVKVRRPLYNGTSAVCHEVNDVMKGPRLLIDSLWMARIGDTCRDTDERMPSRSHN